MALKYYKVIYELQDRLTRLICSIEIEGVKKGISRAINSMITGGLNKPWDIASVKDELAYYFNILIYLSEGGGKKLFKLGVNMVLGGKMVWACPRCRSGRAIRGFRLPLADRFAPLLSLTRRAEVIPW